MEGPDGSGKTTQITMLKDQLEAEGYEVVVTREPGGTKISEKIRGIILDKDNTEMDDVAEALLYAASRAQHVAEIIKPSIEKGSIVICDRFVDSSVVYQGIGRGLGIELVEQINKPAIRDFMPDITFLFKLSPNIGIKRKIDQGDQDRLEREELDFHKRVYEGYLKLENRYSNRIIGIDANQSIDEIHHEIVQLLNQLLKKVVNNK